MKKHPADESSVPMSLPDRISDDIGGAFTIGLAYIGDRLGLFSALAVAGPCSSVELAERTGLQERYVREWLRAHVASARPG